MALERFENNVQHSVGVEVKVANKRLDDFENVGQRHQGQVLKQEDRSRSKYRDSFKYRA